jgi:hypothetical protein
MMTDENLCMAVGCLTIADKICKCRVNVDGKDRIETIRFCKDHFLRQKALDYNRQENIDRREKEATIAELERDAREGNL